MASIGRHTQGNGKSKKTTRLVVSVVQCKVGTALSDTTCSNWAWPDIVLRDLSRNIAYVLCCPFKIKVCLDLTERGRKSCLTGGCGGVGWGCGHFICEK